MYAYAYAYLFRVFDALPMEAHIHLIFQSSGVDRATCVNMTRRIGLGWGCACIIPPKHAYLEKTISYRRPISLALERYTSYATGSQRFAVRNEKYVVATLVGGMVNASSRVGPAASFRRHGVYPPYRTPSTFSRQTVLVYCTGTKKVPVVHCPKY